MTDTKNQITLPFGQNLTEPALEEMTKAFVRQVMDGEMPPIHADVLLSAVKKFAEIAQKQIKPMVIDEAEKYRTEGGVTIYGCKVSLSKTGDTIDYERDPLIADLVDKIDKRKAVIKATKEAGGKLVDEKTGQILDPGEWVTKLSQVTVKISHKEK